MNHMHKVLSGVLVDDLITQLNAKPELWNRYNFRTQSYAHSPHREVDDIILRYRDFSDFDSEQPERFSDEHRAQYYAAYHELPALKALIDNIFTLVDGEELGGILITRIGAGKQVYPHSDQGAWHSEHYLCKALLLLQSAPKQSFNFDNETHEGEAGDLFVFDNRPCHWVINDSDTDRVSLILAIKQKDVPNG